MLMTPLGEIKIYIDGICVDFEATEYAFDRSPCKDKPVAGCYRIEVNAQRRIRIDCTVELLDTIWNTGSSGERYLDAEFIKGSTILTIGMEDENPAFESVRLENGLQYKLLQPIDKVVFGIAWATDYAGTDDVRTWFAADPTISLRRKVYGAISIKDETYYTYLQKLFDAIDNRQKEYNWLITDCNCYPDDPQIAATLCKDHCWISGEDLTEMIAKEDFQWIWGSLSAFDKSTEFSEVLKYPLPYVEDYDGFCKMPVSMQHPLAKIEIAACDSTLVMIFSDDKGIIDSFRAAYPNSEDMEEHIDRFRGEQHD